MATKEYPIGTKVIFIARPHYDKNARDDSGKTATIVHNYGTHVDIFIPDSKNNNYMHSPGETRRVTWHVPWSDIKLGKGVQLLFDFAYE